MRFGEDVSGEGLASQLVAKRRADALQNLAERDAFVADLRSILIRNGDGFTGHFCQIVGSECHRSRDIPLDSERCSGGLVLSGNQRGADCQKRQ